MKRPAFQFYVKDWRNNLKLRRCSEAARGAWIDLLCFMHDSEEYGVLRWPLKEVASTTGIRLTLVKELAGKGVLKGGDRDVSGYTYTPRHAGKSLPTVTLLEPSQGPMWYCSRFVRDEWIRARRGESTRFTSDYHPLSDSPKAAPKCKPKAAPKPPIGDVSGDGSAVASASALKAPSVEGSGSRDIPDSVGKAARAAFDELKALSLAEAKVPGGDDTPAALLASVLMANSIKGTAFHPIVVEWARDGITVERLKAKITQGKSRPGMDAPGRLTVQYLDTFIREEDAKPAHQVQQERAAEAAAKSIKRVEQQRAEQEAWKATSVPMPASILKKLNGDTDPTENASSRRAHQERTMNNADTPDKPDEGQTGNTPTTDPATTTTEPGKAEEGKPAEGEKQD